MCGPGTGVMFKKGGAPWASQGLWTLRGYLRGLGVSLCLVSYAMGTPPLCDHEWLTSARHLQSAAPCSHGGADSVLGFPWFNLRWAFPLYRVCPFCLQSWCRGMKVFLVSPGHLCLAKTEAGRLLASQVLLWSPDRPPNFWSSWLNVPSAGIGMHVHA